MENQTQLANSDSSAASDALESKTLGISPTRYYQPEPRLGFTPYAELWNGRLAMVGFIVALAFEILSSHVF